MQKKPTAVFIGHDDRQEMAFEVCKESIKKKTDLQVDIYPLKHKTLRQIGLFEREWGVDKQKGVYVDASDSIPFSNQFSHTRFLVPEYAKYLGYTDEHVMFVDPDFVFMDDISQLFEEFTFTNSPVACVKHEYNPQNSLKMDGQIQTTYPKKLWSSLMLFDLSRLTRLTKEYVNTASTKDLHRFEWIYEDQIGAISERWNFIPNHSEKRIGNQRIGAIHYTEGLPDMEGYENCKYSIHYKRIAREIYRRRSQET